jgi:hypothetical protein
MLIGGRGLLSLDLECARPSVVYVRQSMAGQLLNNPESRRGQYALVTRGRSVIDADLEECQL